MIEIKDKLYVNLDQLLPLDDLPKVESAIKMSYPLIKQNTWQRVIGLDGKTRNCNWKVKKKNIDSPESIFALEIENETISPMWILDLTVDTNPIRTNCFDSLKTATEDWEKINFRKDLDESWNPFISWLQSLNAFERLGRVSIILGRPGIPVYYHRDSDKYEGEFKPYPHRQEFIWLNLSKDKRVFILNSELKPTQITSQSAFFNHQNWHGSHESYMKWTYSCKIEGIFAKEFREKAGLDRYEQYGEFFN